MSKRVLILIKGLGRGGAEQLIVNAAPYFDRSRFEYEVAFLMPSKTALVGELNAAGLAVSCLGARGMSWVGRLRSLVRRRAIRLVHAHLPFAAIGARVGLRGDGAPRLVYTEHNVWQRYHPATYWANLLTFPQNDHVFCVSDEVRRSIRYPVPLRFRPMPPVETLYHGPDQSSIARWATTDGVRAELGIPLDAPVVGTVANFKTHKGYGDLLRAADLVRREVPAVRFVLVGVGPLEEEMRQRARELELDGTVHFAGFREDAPRVASSFDVFVLSSLHEGLSIALLEAMSLGKPSVVTSVGGLTEVIDDGRQGLLVPPARPEVLAQSVVRLLRDADLRERLGAAAAVRAQEFDIREAVRRAEDVYEGLLS